MTVATRVATGAGIGFVAAILVLAVGPVLMIALRALVDLGMPDPAGSFPSRDAIIRAGTSVFVAFPAAGMVAALAAGALPVTERADRRAFVVCAIAALVWLDINALIQKEAITVSRALVLLVLALVAASFTVIGLWTSVVKAVRAEAPNVPRMSWAGGRRVAAFMIGAIAAVAMAPMLPAVLAGLARGIVGQLPHDAWPGLGAVVVVEALLLGIAFVGFRIAGVPRKMPTGDW